VFFVRATNPVNSLNSPFVANMGTQCIARVGRVRDQTTVPDDPDN